MKYCFHHKKIKFKLTCNVLFLTVTVVKFYKFLCIFSRENQELRDRKVLLEPEEKGFVSHYIE